MNPDEQVGNNAQDQPVPITPSPLEPQTPIPPPQVVQSPPNVVGQNASPDAVAQYPTPVPAQPIEVNPSAQVPVQNQPSSVNTQPDVATSQNVAQPSIVQDSAQSPGTIQPPPPPTSAFSANNTPAGNSSIPPNQALNTAPQQYPMMSGSSLSQNSSGSSKKKLLFIGAIIAAVLVVIGSSVFIFMKYAGGIKLENFSNSDFSIDYPKGYEKKENGVETVFEESGESDDKTKSSVVVFVDKAPTDVSEETRTEYLELLEDNVDLALAGELKSNQKAENSITERIEIEGYEAVKLTTDITEDGKYIGKVLFVGGITDRTYYSVVVLAHVSDPAVEKKASAIIESFDIK